MRQAWLQGVLVAGLLVLGTACRTTPLDNIWPGCAPPVYAPVTILPPAPAPAIPWSVVIDERVSPAVDCNPVRTQHTLVATVLDACGNPLPGQRVEWILARYPDAVGDIIAHDDQYGVGTIAPLASAITGNNGNKIDNHYAISVTNYGTEMIDAGNNHPYEGAHGGRLPDIMVGPGQSWLTITATREGVTDIIVYVPAIRDGTKHKIFAKKIWADFEVRFPENAENTLPDDGHAFPVAITRSDGSGIPGQPVEAEVLDGPDAVFRSSGARTASLLTDANGVASFELQNRAGQLGTNRIRFTAGGSFYGEACPRSRIVTKRWKRVELEVACRMPPEAVVDQPLDKVITVTNTGDATAMGVEIDDQPQGGLQLVDGAAFPLRIGDLAPGQTVSRTVRLVAGAEGHYQNTVSARAAGGSIAQATCSVEVVQGRLEITKICQPAHVYVGDPVDFLVSVRNTGRGPLEEVMVQDDFPAGIEQASQDSVALGRIAPGEVRTITFSGFARETGEHLNVARATARGIPEKQATATVVVVECRLEMDLSGPTEIYVGDRADFTLRVHNVGDGEAEGCLVRVTTGGCLGSRVQDFQVGPLGPGQSWVQDFSVTATDLGSCVVEADSSCGVRCEIRREIGLRVTGLPAIHLEMDDLTVDGRREGIFRVGETFLYRILVENDAGTEATPPLQVILRLPPELEFVSGRSDKGVTVAGTGPAAQSAAFTLDLNEAITFDMQVRVLSTPAAGFVKSEAVVNRASDGARLASKEESTTLIR